MHGFSLNNLMVLCGVFTITLGDKVFIGVDTSVNYNTAVSGCNSVTLSGGQLATFGSQTEYDLLKQIRNFIGRDTYIGLNDINQEGKWRFIDGDSSYCDDFDGTDCDNIPQWASGEPNDAGTGEDVAEIWPDGQLNDIPTTILNAYICEFNTGLIVGASSDTPVNNIPVNNIPDNNYYVLQFTSIKDIVTIFSILLNVILIGGWFFYVTKSFTNKSSSYSKVKVYATEDERL